MICTGKEKDLGGGDLACLGCHILAGGGVGGRAGGRGRGNHSLLSQQQMICTGNEELWMRRHAWGVTWGGGEMDQEDRVGGGTHHMC